MTDTAKTILENYQVRKSSKQKDKFFRFLEDFAKENGYEMTVEKGGLFCKNVIFGSPETAKVIYTAHYDTCARLPFPNFITPLNQSYYWLYQLLITFVFFLIAFAVSFLVTYFSDTPEIVAVASYVTIFGLIFLMMAGPANKHTANDNTSGVVTVLETMKKMPKEERDKVAFVLFDFEEVGLLGSGYFASKYKKVKKETLLINFDCVSDGNNMLFCVKKKASSYAEKIEKAFPSTDRFTSIVKTKGYIYPSDQKNFNLGVGVAALLKSKKGLLYMDKIHTNKDIVFESENIEYLSNGAVELVKSL